jgi:pyrimidine operon attenuation protein/uracil phosphoribosyltransferase
MLPDAEKLLDILAEKIGLPARETAIVGIHTGGAWVAEKLHRRWGAQHPFGTLAVTLHRDDFSTIGLHPQRKSTDIPFEVEGREILLVDDVIHSGRTLRAALNELFDFGRPARVRLACLADRGGRELPFAADYVGASVAVEAGQDLALVNDNDKLRFELRPRTR